MLPSEATALGMAIEEMEKPAAMERMREGRNQYSEPCVPENTGQAQRSRDIAAEAVGMSGPSFSRMKTIVTVAENEDESDDLCSTLSESPRRLRLKRGPAAN